MGGFVLGNPIKGQCRLEASVGGREGGLELAPAQRGRACVTPRGKRPKVLRGHQ